MATSIRVGTLTGAAPKSRLSEGRASLCWSFSCLVVLFPVLLLTATISHAQAPRATITFDNQSGNPALVKLIGSTGRLAECFERPEKHGQGDRWALSYRHPIRRRLEELNHNFEAPSLPGHATSHAIFNHHDRTLHKVADGYYQTEAVSAAEFDQAKP